MQSIARNPDEGFGEFLEKLRHGAPEAWRQLVARFRKRLIGWLIKKTVFYPSDALLDKKQFVEEVFEESLLKFYELFQTGKFDRYEDMEAMMVTIAGYKLKEGFARLKRERKMYAANVSEQSYESAQLRYHSRQPGDEYDAEEMIIVIKESIGKLDSEERDLLISYFNGEELQDIAITRHISPEACRKRKQRALEKLKTFVFASLKTIIGLLWPITIFTTRI